MVEFLLGLVGIMLLMVGLNFIARIVYEDFKTTYETREEVAKDLAAGNDSGSANYAEDNSYSPSSDFYSTRDGNIGYAQLVVYQESYPAESGHVNGFDSAVTGDPLEQIVGSHPDPKKITPDSTLLGVDGMRIDNAVWMPPWTDLMTP